MNDRVDQACSRELNKRRDGALRPWSSAMEGRLAQHGRVRRPPLLHFSNSQFLALHNRKEGQESTVEREVGTGPQAVKNACAAPYRTRVRSVQRPPPASSLARIGTEVPAALLLAVSNFSLSLPPRCSSCWPASRRLMGSCKATECRRAGGVSGRDERQAT